MILPDLRREIIESLRTHKVRTAPADLIVAWGILMLVLLPGDGRGFQSGVELLFREDAINTISIRQGIGANVYFDSLTIDLRIAIATLLALAVVVLLAALIRRAMR